ncbi:MAG: Gfo/Idh/MocA family protein, partial [Acidimicrobiales bacterium]
QIPERPLPKPGGTHYDAGKPGDPTGTVENEDYFGAMCVFENGARGVFETSRSIVGPQSQCAFEVYGTKGSLMWNLETMNELQLFLTKDAARGYTTVYSGDRYPYHGNFVPGDANPIGYEDLKVIEEFEFLSSVANERRHEPGFAEAIDYVSVQDAMLRSWQSERWETVERLSPRH